MAKINSHYPKLKREYLFSIIERKLAEMEGGSSSISLVNLGIGDISLPLAPAIMNAICKATEEMGREGAHRGYGPSHGYSFLREAIAKEEYAYLGIPSEEIFISDGTNSDMGNIQEIFSLDCVVGVPSPAYPLYLDSNILAGRQKKICVLPCLEKNNFNPVPPEERCDLIYLCSPHNPTGGAMSKKELLTWVEYAHANRAIILYDNVYFPFISSPDIPYSIFEVRGAREVAVEFRSFSKRAGFTGLRCAYTVLPKTVYAYFGKKKLSLHALWAQRQAVRFNGVAYPIQKGAEAVFSEEGRKQTGQQVQFYKDQAKNLSSGLKAMGYTSFGGVHSPYIWWKVPEKRTSWEFFDLLLQKCRLLSIPGRGFGEEGEGYMRLSSFTTPDKVQEALKRIATL